jgi:uncharacterized cupredoxin-like copper-binding protein
LYDGIEFKEGGLSINLKFIERLRFMKRQLLLGALALMIVALLAACAGTPYTVKGSQRVQVKLSDYKIDTSLTSFIADKPYHFIITNAGQTLHEFMIMPKAEGSISDMSMGDRMSLAKVENISPGETKVLDYLFPSSTAGTHPQFACYYSGHYKAGMKQDVTIHT